MNVYTSKTDLVAAMMRELIVTGEFAPGVALRQRDLAARFGVSPTPVREALRRLESEGLVKGNVHRGVTVTAAQQGAVEENYRIRAALEPLAAEMAAGRISEDVLAELEDINASLSELPDGDPAYMPLNARFHLTLYGACGSPVLVSLLRLLWQSMPKGPRPQRSVALSARQHADMIAALRAGEGARVSELVRDHVLGALPARTEGAAGERPKSA
ncbi:GntR family transcriptional regulator [Pseudonocardia sp. H11422]|uniref:GntR family transcriptional regulator n=1 Tax=Pseudonocardia sp. H11422 TaxID=2835866 RepID=UPI0027E285AF|nr:GntR family transcriptional regulator [Pseudonocardia sp. H11422]